MSILFLLVPITLLFLSIAIWAFFWSVNNGQYDDLESPAQSILIDDDNDLDPYHTQAQKPSDSDEN